MDHLSSENGTVEEPCANCGERPRSKKHTWCNECKAASQREYSERKAAHQTTRGFALGATAMRMKLLADLAERHPAGMVLVAEVAHWIRNAPAPEPQIGTAVDTSNLAG